MERPDASDPEKTKWSFWSRFVSILTVLSAVATIAGFMYQLGMTKRRPEGSGDPGVSRAVRDSPVDRELAGRAGTLDLHENKYDGEERRSRSFPRSLPATTPVSAAESVAWENALANRRDCDSIRKYILDYPSGYFVASAQALISARREITEERWVTFDFPSNVVASSSLESRTSRTAACESAQLQMRSNMSDGCGIFKADPTRYRSVVVVPSPNASCDCQNEAISLDDQEGDPVWRCSIRSSYSCRGEQAERVKRFVCD